MIYVVGSINTDFAFNLSKFPRAGETVSAESLNVNLGGKGANQAVAVRKTGAPCTFIGKVGNDERGSELKRKLAETGVNTDFVTVANAPSGLAAVLVHKGNNRIVLSKGANEYLECADVSRGLGGAKAGDVLVLQLEVPLNVVAHALRVGKNKGMITVLNPAPAVPLTYEIYENAEIIAPNETETKILTGINPDCEVNLALAVKKFKDMGANNIIITLGSAGSAVAVGREITLIPAIKVKAADTTAAGDTYIGAFAAKTESGQDILSSAKFATYASALKVTRRGAAAAIPSIEETEAFIKQTNKESR